MSLQAPTTQEEIPSSNRSKSWLGPDIDSVFEDRERIDSSYGSIQTTRSRSSSESPSFNRLRNISRSPSSSRNSLSSVSIRHYPHSPQIDYLENVQEEDEGFDSNLSPSVESDIEVNTIPKQACCSCIRITPKRFRTAAQFRRCPQSFALCLVYIMFFMIGVTEKGAFLVLFFSLNAYHKLNPPETVAVHTFILAAVHLLYPVMGFIADTFFGRYKVILACLHIAWFGSAILAIAFIKIDPLFDAKAHSDIDSFWSLNSVIALSVGYLFVAAGLTGIRVNLIPFGVDQLPDASSGELSSYFHWYFWCLRAGNMFSILTVPFVYNYSALSFIFTAFAISISVIIIILLVFQNDLQILPKSGNPLAHIYKVLRFASKQPKPRLISAFQRGQRPPPWIDRAMVQYGGKFTVEEVENVKTFFRILLILISFFGFFIVYAHVQTTTILQGFRMQPLSYANCSELILKKLHRDVNISVHCQYWTIPPSIGFGVTNLAPLLLLIPLFDRFIYTCLSSWKIFSMFGRIAIGKFFILTSILMGLAVEVYRLHANQELFSHFDFKSSLLNVNAIPFHTANSLVFHVATPVSILLVLPQYFIFAFAELFASITIVEFIYAQSPAGMKGLLLGCMFGTEGVSMGLAGLLVLLHDVAPKFGLFSYFGNSNSFYKKVTTSLCLDKVQNGYECEDSAVGTFALFALIAILSIILFTVAAVKYKYRRRDVDPYLPIWLIPSTENEDGLGQRILRACCS